MIEDDISYLEEKIITLKDCILYLVDKLNFNTHTEECLLQKNIWLIEHLNVKSSKSLSIIHLSNNELKFLLEFEKSNKSRTTYMKSIFDEIKRRQNYIILERYKRNSSPCICGYIIIENLKNQTS